MTKRLPAIFLCALLGSSVWNTLQAADPFDLFFGSLSALNNVGNEAAPACNGSSFAACPQSRFFASAEAMMLKLERSWAQDLILDQNSFQPLLSTRDLNFDFEWGPRVTVGYLWDPDTAIEFSYFGFLNWHTSATATGDNDLLLAGDLGLAAEGFSGADSMIVNYSAKMHNAEANLARRIGVSSFEMLTGFRYINLREKFEIVSIDTEEGKQGDYRISAENNLFGCQLGLRWREQFGRFGVEAVGKAGIFANRSHQRTFVGDFANATVLRDSHTADTDIAFVGEIGLTGSWRLSDAILIKTGYNVMWMDGVARATDQLDFTNTETSGTALRNHGSALIHGTTIGVEIRW